MTDTHTLYRYFDARGNLLYIGITSRGIVRSFEHAETKSWWSSVARADYVHFDARWRALDAERALIQIQRPLFNKVHNGGGMDWTAKSGEASISTSGRPMMIGSVAEIDPDAVRAVVPIPSGVAHAAFDKSISERLKMMRVIVEIPGHPVKKRPVSGISVESGSLHVAFPNPTASVRTGDPFTVTIDPLQVQRDSLVVLEAKLKEFRLTPSEFMWGDAVRDQLKETA